MTGYGALATLMATHQNAEAFRRFSSMNMESILQMQAELLHLQMEIDEARIIPGLNKFDRVWVDYSEKTTSDHMRCLFERSRSLLDQYYRALLLTTKINAMQTPEKDALELRQRWYDEESGGNQFLTGVEAGIFVDTDHETDLLTLNGSASHKDVLAKLLGEKVLPLYHRMIGRWLHRSMTEQAFDGLWEYRSESLVRVGNFLSMLLSAVIPALSILVLFNVKSTAARLTTISLMALLFSLLMSMIAQHRSEIFISTTAFAAVLVVFVQGSPDVMDR